MSVQCNWCGKRTQTQCRCRESRGREGFSGPFAPEVSAPESGKPLHEMTAREAMLIYNPRGTDSQVEDWAEAKCAERERQVRAEHDATACVHSRDCIVCNQRIPGAMGICFACHTETSAGALPLSKREMLRNRISRAVSEGRMYALMSNERADEIADAILAHEWPLTPEPRRQMLANPGIFNRTQRDYHGVAHLEGCGQDGVSCAESLGCVPAPCDSGRNVESASTVGGSESGTPSLAVSEGVPGEREDVTPWDFGMEKYHG